MKFRPTERFSLLLYTIAVIVFLCLAFAAFLHIRRPIFGFSWSMNSGNVLRVDSDAAIQAGIREGMRIVAFDGRPVKEARGLPGRLPGDQLNILLEDEGQLINVSLELEAAPFGTIFTRLVVIFAAFSFWALGLSVAVFGRLNLQGMLFFLSTQTIAAILGTGSVSSHTPVLVGWIFVVLFWVVSPLLLHLHIELFGSASRRLKLLITLSYIITAMLAISDIVLTNTDQGEYIQVFQYFWFILHLIGVVIITLQVLFRKYPVELRRTARLISLAVFLGFMPFIVLSMLPQVFAGDPLVPYEISMISLVVTPLGYTYAILRHQLIRYDPYVNRSAALFLSLVLVGTIYSIAYSIIQTVFGSDASFQPIILFLIPLVLSFMVQPLLRVTQGIVNHIFYGEWYDDMAIVKQVSKSIDNPFVGKLHLGRNLCQTLVTTLGLENARLVLRDGQVVANEGGASDSDLVTIGRRDFECLCEELLEHAGQEMGQVAEALSLDCVARIPQRKVLFERTKAWFLLKSGSAILGLLILGGKRGGGDYSGKDLEVLEVSLRQTKAILENAYLIEELELQAENIKKLHMEVMLSREEERKRIARDLHDQTIQALVGFNYQIDRVRSTKGGADETEMDAFQQEVKKMLDEVRQICSALRPPALDSVGLAPAIQSRIEELTRGRDIDIQFFLEGNDDDGSSERAMFCLFRVFQEAMTNVIKHAEAKNASVTLKYSGDRITLVVEDDGRGFELPPKIDYLIEDHHFGLIGIQEMVETLGGKLRIVSSPGVGCKVVAQVPCAEI